LDVEIHVIEAIGANSGRVSASWGAFKGIFGQKLIGLQKLMNF